MPRSESFAASQARVIINPHSERLNRHVVLRWAVCPGNHGREEREAKREVRVRWYSFISAGASSKSTRARTRAGTLRSCARRRSRGPEPDSVGPRFAGATTGHTGDEEFATTPSPRI
jgi:hypothetical protein